MKNPLKATYSVEMDENTLAKTLETILDETIRLKPSFKYKVNSVLLEVITYEEEKR